MMLLALAIILAVLWLLGLVAFHVTSFALHILIILAVIAVIAHFVTAAGRGRPLAEP